MAAAVAAAVQLATSFTVSSKPRVWGRLTGRCREDEEGSCGSGAGETEPDEGSVLWWMGVGACEEETEGNCLHWRCHNVPCVHEGRTTLFLVVSACTVEPREGFTGKASLMLVGAEANWFAR